MHSPWPASAGFSRGRFNKRGVPLTSVAADARGGAVASDFSTRFLSSHTRDGEEVFFLTLPRFWGAEVAAQILSTADVGPKASPPVLGAAGEALNKRTRVT